MKHLIPSIQESVLNPTYDISSEMLEIGIDTLLENEMLKNIPIVSTISALCRVGINIHERNLLKQTISFIAGFNAKAIEESKLEAYRKNLDENPQKAESEFSRVVIILNSHIDEIQSNIFGNFYRAYVRGAISWEKLCELSEANRRMFVVDYTLLRQIIEQPEREISPKRLYQYDRLISLGLMQRESIATGATRLGRSSFSVIPTGISTTTFGRAFYQHMQPVENVIVISSE